MEVLVAKRKYQISVGSTTYSLDARPDRLDLRDRAYLPPTLSLPNQWPREKDVERLFPAYANAGLILDQGREGACTGFGLAAVVNYLLWTRSHLQGDKGKFKSVSPYMLYDLARFYDEWPGQDYDGSSCRGAMKGWHKHGVCDQMLWSRTIYPMLVKAGATGGKTQAKRKTVKKVAPGFQDYIPDQRWPQDAAQRPVGVYYRIDKNSVTDLQAAIYDVGAIYVSCSVHGGWSRVKSVKSNTVVHSRLPRIPFDPQEKPDGGHAFAMVGFNEDGFVIQNSWGKTWGHSGFAVLAYDDWVANGTDAWVCALGVPQSQTSRVLAHGNAFRTVNNASLLSGDRPIKVKPTNPKAKPWSTATALEHSIVAGNDGEVVISRPDHAQPRISISHAVELFHEWAKSWTKQNPGQMPKLAIYAHGGLNSEVSAIERARVLGPYFKENGVYPLFYIWKTGFLEVLEQAAMDQIHLDPSETYAAGVIGEARDRLLEAAAHGPFRFMWRQMKQNAQAAAAKGHALGLLRSSLGELEGKMSFETHYVAHSAGSFVVGHMMDLGQQATSLSLFAPACSLEFALHYIKPHAPLGKTALHLLTAKAEMKDFTGLRPPLAYGKSLLWLVGRGFEEKSKTPLAGFAQCLNPKAKEQDDLWCEDLYAQVKEWRNWVKSLPTLPLGQAPLNEVSSHHVVHSGKDMDEAKTITGSHGGFDNDINVIEETISLISGFEASNLPVRVESLDY
jgi:Papain family cysteine protease